MTEEHNTSTPEMSSTQSLLSNVTEKESVVSKPMPCSMIPIPDEYWGMSAKQSLAFMSILHNGSISPGETVCVRAIVPSSEHKHKNNLLHNFETIPGTPWDSIMIDMVGINTGVSVPVELQMVNHRQNNERVQTHIYEADVALYDVDTYHPEGYIEFRDAKWNPGPSMDPQPLEPEPIVVFPSNQTISVMDKNNISPYSLSRHMDLPLCTEPNLDGRWISLNELEFDPGLVSPSDNNNRAWLPYNCRLKRYTYKEFAKCLINRYPLMHWFGDSNSRRALKKITSLGKWCSTPDAINTLTCRCNDNVEEFTNYMVHNLIAPIDIDPIRGGSTPVGITNYSNAPPGNSRIVAFKWDGLTDRNNPPWASYFDSEFSNRMGSPAVTIFGLTNWDVAFSSFSFFAKEVDKLIKAIDMAYKDNIDIILRTGQYYCCTSDTDVFWKRRYSRLRNQYFDRYLIHTFKQHFDGRRRVRIWNVSRISETRPYDAREEVQFCAANHARSEVVEIENQVLMNAMCN
ncbi:hypothetical protein H4R24_002947 [Coemansia sp. RSA 988]|nr:hypothetical protein H4R24_002947 [Coemansia sp. RSA 988]